MKLLAAESSLLRKIKIHLWTLPRWFAAPFFGLSAVMGALQAGGMTSNSWLGLLASLLIMAGGHAFNSYLDYAWTHLDQGGPDERSAVKSYSGAQNLLARGEVSLKGVLVNALSWYFLALIVLIYLTAQGKWPVLLAGLGGMLVTFWYSRAKFNWTHELSLGIGAGPLASLVGFWATESQGFWLPAVLGGLPFGMVLSFAGLALDEWPDAEANLKKGVKSIAYKIWEYGISLEWYLSAWLTFLLIYQLLLIILGIYRPLTGITFLTWPLFIGSMIFLKQHFTHATAAILMTAVLYFFLLIIGQVLG